MTTWFGGRNGPVVGKEEQPLTDKQIEHEIAHKVHAARNRGYSEDYINDVLRPMWLEKLQPSDADESHNAEE